MFSTKWSPISSFTGALCDSVITGSIWLFMRPARTGNVRRKSRNYISEMMWIFINMGLFSCIVAITVAVLSYRTVLYRCARSGDREILYELDDGGAQC
jgi:hypothetical protein